jgi:berberine-like enzyme
MFGEFETFWSSAADDAVNVDWLRDLYGQAFAGKGGYPVRNDRVDGCYINNPYMDITDPAYNKSGVGWPELYFGENYARLQHVKARWDPTDFFRHRQSVRLP